MARWGRPLFEPVMTARMGPQCRLSWMMVSGDSCHNKSIQLDTLIELIVNS